MNRDNIFSLREFFATQTNHWFFFVAVLIFYTERILLPGFGDVCAWILLGFIPSILQLVRKNSSRHLTVFFFHIAVVAAAAVLPLSTTGVRILYLVFAMGYVLLSLLRVLQNTEYPTRVVPPYLFLGLTFLVPFILSFRENVLYYFPFCVAMILQAGMFFLTFFMDKFFQFTSRNAETASSMPEKKIFSSGIRIAALYMLAVSGILFLVSLMTFPEEWYRQLRLGLKKIVSNLIYLLFGWIFLSGDTQLEQEYIDESSIGGQMISMSGEPSVFWMLLEKIFIILMFIGLITLFLNVFLRILRYLSRWNIREEAEEDAPEEEDVRVKLSPRKMTPVTEKEEGWLSIRQRIRRLYKKKLLESTGDRSFLKSLTAREFSVEQNNPLLGEIYEKARYSNASCDRQDLKKMQLACRRKKN